MQPLPPHVNALINKTIELAELIYWMPSGLLGMAGLTAPDADGEDESSSSSGDALNWHCRQGAESS